MSKDAPGTFALTVKRAFRSEFTLKGLCSYIVYWGMEDKRIAGDNLPEDDKERISVILNRIVRDGRISKVDATSFVKSK